MNPDFVLPLAIAVLAVSWCSSCIAIFYRLRKQHRQIAAVLSLAREIDGKLNAPAPWALQGNIDAVSERVGVIDRKQLGFATTEQLSLSVNSLNLAFAHDLNALTTRIDTLQAVGYVRDGSRFVKL